jgi:ADP-ribose pyrophosphatase YjhB (NUDIX family)
VRYCIVKRSKDPGKDKWSLPGGSVELGEEILLAAAREAREETGLTKEDLRFYPHAVCTTDAIYWREREGWAEGGKREKEVQFHYVITHQAAFITTGAVERARAGDDAAELAFKTLEELKTMTLDGVLVGSVCDVVMRVERLVAKGVINLEFDLVTLEA